MSAPISMMARGALLASGVVLAFSAFFAAYPYRTKHRKKLNTLSFAIGVVTILFVVVVLNSVH